MICHQTCAAHSKFFASTEISKSKIHFFCIYSFMFHIEYLYKFHLWIAAVQLDKLRCYLHLTKECRDIATTIHPHYEKMYPCGVCQMTALDSKLFQAALAMKIEFYELNLITLWNLLFSICLSVSLSLSLSPRCIPVVLQNDCSWSRAFPCSTSHENRILWAKPHNSLEFAFLYLSLCLSVSVSVSQMYPCGVAKWLLLIQSFSMQH